MASETILGACLCGAVLFEIRLPALFCAHCHCSVCRRAHGAGYVTWVGALADGFKLLTGENQLARYRSSNHGTRSFCKACGSTLFFNSAHDPERVDVVLANLRDAADLQPQFHVYFDDRATWVEVNDGLPRLGGPTGLEPL
jgi:hypothetical protein